MTSNPVSNKVNITDTTIVENKKEIDDKSIHDYVKTLPTCLICLGKIADSVATFPGCKHLFHVSCLSTFGDPIQHCPSCHRSLQNEEIVEELLHQQQNDQQIVERVAVEEPIDIDPKNVESLSETDQQILDSLSEYNIDKPMIMFS